MPTLHQCYFNSIKVQLKRVAKATAKNYALFQFHKGTIKTKDEVKKRITECSFQFHKGTIKTYDYFNFIELLVLFQFHKGTIKTWCSISYQER